MKKKGKNCMQGPVG